MDYEYKCVGAPERPRRSRRAKTPSDRVARAMEKIIQEEAVNGWEYMRTDLVPVIEKSSILGRTQEVHRAVLVFRRDLEARQASASDRSKARPRDGSTELFSGSASRRRQPGVRRAPAEEPAEPLRDAEPVAATAQAETVETPPRRPRAVPAEEPIRLTADDRADVAADPRDRDRAPPSGLG